MTLGRSGPIQSQSFQLKVYLLLENAAKIPLAFNHSSPEATDAVLWSDFESQWRFYAELINHDDALVRCGENSPLNGQDIYLQTHVEKLRNSMEQLTDPTWTVAVSSSSSSPEVEDDEAISMSSSPSSLFRLVVIDDDDGCPKYRP